MMNLQEMVVGLESDHIAKRLMHDWHHDAGTLKFWRVSSNLVYVFENDRQRFFLRFSRGEDKSVPQIEAELDFMNYLRSHGYANVADTGLVGLFFDSMTAW